MCQIDATNKEQMSEIGQTDWVTIEVGGHIEKAHEQAVFDNINSVARRGIILSWAVPKQGGYQQLYTQRW